MRAQDIIAKKRDGHPLSNEEILFLIQGAVSGDIPKYQISAFLMAVYFKGMDSEETGYLTSALIDSGNTVSLSPQHAPYVDKHSTGGVGDGTSLVIAPILAACGLYVPMLSGRALGHTGGTLDKMDSIPNYQTQLSVSQFVRTVEAHGYAMCGQTDDLAPADRYLYALRDVTATVESVPLITSSILSKKFAEGADVLVFDIKCGRGAFARDLPFAQRLARQLIETGTRLNKKIRAVITDMNQPLGVMVGNFLEVEQAAAVLNGYEHQIYEGDAISDYVEVSIYLCAQILLCAGAAADKDAAVKSVERVIADGSAWRYFRTNITAQQGDVDQLQRMFGNRRAAHSHTVRAAREGYIRTLDAYTFGIAAATLGVGRLTVDSDIDPEAGIQLCKKEGDGVAADEPICILYSNDQSSLSAAEQLLQTSGIGISAAAPPPRRGLIIETIEK